MNFQVYPMPAEKLGRAFVLNFLPDKKETAEDAITLDEGFHKMGFKVTTEAIKSNKVRHRFTPSVSIISRSMTNRERAWLWAR